MTSALPEFYSSGSTVAVEDFDKDGDLDLFVGGRHVPGKYPFPANSYLLENISDGNEVKFINSTALLGQTSQKLGMVTDAEWIDIDADGWPDLVVVGEWMPIKIFKNYQGGFKDISTTIGTDQLIGWWNCIESADLDGDGDLDLIAGNLGLNYKYKASQSEPFEVYAHDFDSSGNIDIALGYYSDKELFPVRGRECTLQQIPSIKKRFPNYTEFSKANFEDVYPKHMLDSSLIYKANTFANAIFINEGGSFIFQPLENQMQISSINAIVIDDFNNDGAKDVLAGGNLYNSEVETPRNDASYGMVAIGDKQKTFSFVPPLLSGLNLQGEVRNIQKINITGKMKGWLIGRNNSELILISTKDKANKN